MDNQEKLNAIIQQLQEVYSEKGESAYKEGYADGKSGVTVISHNITQHDDKGVGLHIVLTNGREVYFSESF